MRSRLKVPEDITDNLNGTVIPAGELVRDKATNLLYMGDGVTVFEDLDPFLTGPPGDGGGGGDTATGIKRLASFQVGAEGAPMASGATVFTHADLEDSDVLVFADGDYLTFTPGDGGRYITKELADDFITFPGGVNDKEKIAIYVYVPVDPDPDPEPEPVEYEEKWQEFEATSTSDATGYSGIDIIDQTVGTIDFRMVWTNGSAVNASLGTLYYGKNGESFGVVPLQRVDSFDNPALSGSSWIHEVTDGILFIAITGLAETEIKWKFFYKIRILSIAPEV